MKITKTELREIIREELQKLTEAPKKYHVGWIVGKQYNEKTALKAAIKLGYGKNANKLYVVQDKPGYFTVYEKV